MLLLTISGKLRNAQSLPDLDLVRVLEDVPVRFEDLRIERGIAVVLPCDLRQRVALDDHMELRVRILTRRRVGFVLLHDLPPARWERDGELRPKDNAPAKRARVQ